MKTFFTKHLLIFALIAAVFTLIFRYFLSYGIENKLTWMVVSSAVLYFVGMFGIGYYYGKADAERLPIHDVGFRFHLVTYLVHNIISYLWFYYGFNSHYERISTIYITVMIWGFFLFIHFIFYIWSKKNSIEGLNKEDLFD
jgi:hypothetical protein